jgi:hypothetical protein
LSLTSRPRLAKIEIFEVDQVLAPLGLLQCGLDDGPLLLRQHVRLAGNLLGEELKERHLARLRQSAHLGEHGFELLLDGHGHFLP